MTFIGSLWDTKKVVRGRAGKRIIFMPRTRNLRTDLAIPMELSEELDQEMKKIKREHHKRDLETQIHDLSAEINRAGHAVSDEIKKAMDTGTGPAPENAPE